ncbi:MAG: ThuA domain-containing protein [Bryobacteraceae bacterium]|nr:ThuA domain-containing protein [Bryobacteraceae bacterium]
MVLFVTGQTDSLYHHWEQTTPQIIGAIREHTPCEARVLEEARAVTPEALAGYQAIFINYNGPRLGPAQEKAIEEFVRRGGGLVSFHQGLYGEWFGQRFNAQRRWEETGSRGWAAWEEMIGARWNPELLGHTLRGVFEVKCQSHPACAEASFTANDELYHRFDLKPGTKVVATAFSDTKVQGTGKVEPIAWTNSYGQGRVFFTTLGHDATALYQPGVRRLFARATEWAATGSASAPRAAAKPVRVLAVTGGHGYPEAFYSLLNGMPGIEWKHAPSHEDAFRRPINDRFDVLLLHDMYERVTPAAQHALERWVEAGKGVISLHHAIVDYTEWPFWWQEVIGGKYFVEAKDGYKKSSYKEGVEFVVRAVKGKQGHPVLEGVPPLAVEDEMYKDMWHSPRIEVLMETDNPLNDRPVVYIGPHAKARAIHIQLGHSAHTMENPGYRLLIRNAIEWAARRR